MTRSEAEDARIWMTRVVRKERGTACSLRQRKQDYCEKQDNSGFLTRVANIATGLGMTWLGGKMATVRGGAAGSGCHGRERNGQGAGMAAEGVRSVPAGRMKQSKRTGRGAAGSFRFSGLDR